MSPNFEAPSQIRDQLLSELYINAGLLNPCHIFAKVIDGDVEQPAVEDITWRQLLGHAQAIAVEFSKEIQPREPGTSPRTVGILAKNGYSYVPHFLAMSINGWTVYVSESLFERFTNLRW